MIKDLKRKVFWSILLSAAGVLLVILIAINILSFVQTGSKIESIMNSAYELTEFSDGSVHGNGEGTGHGKKEDKKGGKGKSELMRSVSEDELGILIIGSDGSIVSRSGCAASMDEDDLSVIAGTAFSDEDGSGQAEGWVYRTVQRGNELGVVFLNAASLRRENMQMLLLSIAAFILSSGLFAAVAKFLSNTIAKPVEENVRMQKQFVADASHELKTPLTVIDANTAVLEKTTGPNKWLDYIKQQTERMAGLVNELLQLSSIDESEETGKDQGKTRYDASEAVMSAVLPFESLAFERGITLETDIPETIQAAGKPDDLEQLTYILLDNAVKHSRQGGSIKVIAEESAVHHSLRGERALQLRVSNTGDDIPQEALPHVFDRFFRADPARTNKDNSYGLGLAIAKGLAERNGGTIAADSGNGITEFTLTIPIGPEDDQYK